MFLKSYNQYLKSKMVKSQKSATPTEDSSESDSEDDESSSDSISDSEDSESSEEEVDEEDTDSGKGTTSEEEETDSSDDEALRTSKSNNVKQTSASGSKGKSQPLMQLVPKGKTVVKGKFVVKMKGVPYKVEEVRFWWWWYACVGGLKNVCGVFVFWFCFVLFCFFKFSS